ncbi:MAG: hypothetical protein HY644_06820 [Acidobacteria bacterium]|nr:hypothetical protein [Acidobacteriota bacterium]
MSHRGGYTIDDHQLRMGWKILRTLADQYALSPSEQSFLLHGVAMIALRDSLIRGEIEWSADRCRLRLLIVDDRVQVRSEENGMLPLLVHPDITEEEADAAYNLVETLLDKHQMPEHERVGLYSALPCIAFHALQDHYLRWNVSPPFKGLGPKIGIRRRKE